MGDWSSFLARAVGGQRATCAVGLTCLAALIVACYGGVLFGGRQFAFRDSAHFYYPLYWRVQQEWSAGRLPLWEPGENGGTPMLGSPMAAVLYPGKLLFALVPYAWGVRLYTVAHEVLAFGAMVALTALLGRELDRRDPRRPVLRLRRAGPLGLFQHHLPRGGGVGPAGFPCSRPLAAARATIGPGRAGPGPGDAGPGGRPGGGLPHRPLRLRLCDRPGAVTGRSRRLGPGSGDWGSSLPSSVGPGRARTWRPDSRLGGADGPDDRRGGLGTRRPGLRGEPAARAPRSPGRDAPGPGRVRATLAILLAAAQLLPVLEQIVTSVRWTGTGPGDLYDFSLLPYQAFEWIWPNVFGTFSAGNRYWISLLSPARAPRPWVLSFFIGALPLVLAFGASGFRGGPPWRAWMTAVALLSFWASLGEFAGPSRWSGGGAVTHLRRRQLLRTPRDDPARLPPLPLPVQAPGLHGPGPVGPGRDRLGSGRDRCGPPPGRRRHDRATRLDGARPWRPRRDCETGSSRRWRPRRVSSQGVFGPFDAPGAVAELLRGLGHGAVALGLSLVVVVWSARRPGPAGLAALVLLATDLAVANARLVITIPQADFEREPEVLRAIRAAERADPSPGPFRVHRLSSWVPIGWSESASTRRLRELVDWEIDTLQPGFGLLHGVSYVLTDESETGTRRLPASLPAELPAGRRPGRGRTGGGARQARCSTIPGGRSTSGGPVTSSSPPTPATGRATTAATPRSSTRPS